MLVNNAGIAGRYDRFAELPHDVTRRTIDANPMDALPMAQEAVRRWQAADTRGRVVDVSSIAATLGSPGEHAHYAVTKAAIDALTVRLGKKVAAPGIRIDAVAPERPMPASMPPAVCRIVPPGSSGGCQWAGSPNPMSLPMPSSGCFRTKQPASRRPL
jgi:NAD(P)-dependent dehydrogenase (short-subunit alcohol dehydrogenase family)